MMTDRDKEEQDLSLDEDGQPTIGNSATLRTVLALRNVVYSDGHLPGSRMKDGFRVVVQLQEACVSSLRPPMHNDDETTTTKCADMRPPLSFAEIPFIS